MDIKALLVFCMIGVCFGQKEDDPMKDDPYYKVKEVDVKVEELTKKDDNYEMKDDKNKNKGDDMYGYGDNMDPINAVYVNKLKKEVAELYLKLGQQAPPKAEGYEAADQSADAGPINEKYVKMLKAEKEQLTGMLEARAAAEAWTAQQPPTAPPAQGQAPMPNMYQYRYNRFYPGNYFGFRPWNYGRFPHPGYYGRFP